MESQSYFCLASATEGIEDWAWMGTAVALCRFLLTVPALLASRGDLQGKGGQEAGGGRRNLWTTAAVPGQAQHPTAPKSAEGE